MVVVIESQTHFFAAAYSSDQVVGAANAAIMGSGATTVVSAQWEANDKSTEIFTKNFYGFYKQGSSSAEALQKASLELIKNKSNKMHKPYYWADFTLNGDYR